MKNREIQSRFNRKINCIKGKKEKNTLRIVEMKKAS